MKLINVVLYLKDQRLEAVLEEAPGKRRKVVYTWLSQKISSLPTSWYEDILAEAADQDSRSRLPF